MFRFWQIHQIQSIHIFFYCKNQALKTIKDTAGISPYPIIPHTALIHNEELVGITEKEKTKEEIMTNANSI